MTDTVEAFLEHHGVRGQKWGVRRFGRGTSGGKTAAERQHRRNQIKVGAVAGGIGLAVIGAVVAKSMLNQYGSTRLSEISTSIKRPLQAHELVRKSGPIKASSISPKLAERAFRAQMAAAMGSRNNKAILRDTAAKHLTSVNEANTQLKGWYNKGNVPIPKREFLDTKFWEKAAGR